MAPFKCRGLVAVPVDKIGLFGTLEAKPLDGKAFSIAHPCGDYVLIPRYIKNPAMSYMYPEHVDGKYEFFGELLPYQDKAVDDCITYLHQECGVLLRADCGTGKTVMSLAVASLLEIKRTIVLVDQANIADQWVERIKQFLHKDAVVFSGEGEDIAKAKESTAEIKVIMAQSLMKQDWILDPIATDLLIVDEAHVFSAPVFSGSMKNISFRYSMGLTATPDRKDNLQWVFQAILGTATVDVKAKARIAKVRAVELPFLKDVRSEDYEFFWCGKNRKVTWEANRVNCQKCDGEPMCHIPKPLSKQRINLAALTSCLVDSEEYNKWILDSCDQLLKSGRHIMVFSQLRKHLKQLYTAACKRFGEDKCGIYLGVQVKDDETKRAVAMDRRLSFCTFGVANKALDVPHKDTAIFATPKSDVRQTKGRIERNYFDKKDPLIIDPVFPHINMFKYMWYARRKIYRDSGSEVSVSTL